MTGAMLLAAAAMMRGQWSLASLWLFVAIVTKPLAVVMVSICGWVIPFMRWTSAAAILALRPRNEYLSFLVLTPLTALALLLFAADKDDLRGWAPIVIGWHWSLQIDRFLKPALVCGVYLWLGWLMITSKRWQLIFDRGVQPRDVGQ
jgi:hypothetical protein